MITSRVAVVQPMLENELFTQESEYEAVDNALDIDRGEWCLPRDWALFTNSVERGVSDDKLGEAQCCSYKSENDRGGCGDWKALDTARKVCHRGVA